MVRKHKGFKIRIPRILCYPKKSQIDAIRLEKMRDIFGIVTLAINQQNGLQFCDNHSFYAYLILTWASQKLFASRVTRTN